MKPFILSVVTAILLCAKVSIARYHGERESTGYTPVAYHLGQQSPAEPTGFQHCNVHPSYTLDSSTPVLSLDYGTEVAGFPYVEISSLDGEYAQIELKYSEPYEGLGLPYGDGPWYDVIQWIYQTSMLTDVQRQAVC